MKLKYLRLLVATQFSTRIMRLRHIALLLTASLSPTLAAPAFAASTPAASTSGAWSKPVDGLQGRLIARDDPPFNGTRMIAVYLELRNVSDVLNPLEVSYDGANFRGGMRDKKGKVVPQAGLPCSILNPPGYLLVLPNDSTLKFRVSVMGYGVPKDSGALIGLNSGDWLIKRGDKAPYFLSGPFRSATKSSSPNVKWSGVLQLPPVRIPAAPAAAK